MGTQAIVAVQSKTGWQYTTVQFDGHTMGPLLARWYKDIGKARQLLRYDHILSLPSDPALVDAERMEEPWEVSRREDVFGVRRFCKHFYFLANKPNAKWIYAQGSDDDGRQIDPGDIPGHRVWVDVIRSKGTYCVHVYIGEERVMHLGDEKISRGFGLAKKAQALGEKLHAFMQEAKSVQDNDKLPVYLLGDPRQKILSMMQKTP